MAIKFHYPAVVLDKMRRLLDRAEEQVPFKQDERYKKTRRDVNKHVRAAWVKDRCGMNIGYLQGCLAGDNMEPSGRVLKNMGFEVYIKDLETGELTQVNYFGICEVDHSNPSDPKVVYESE